jgi:hypothetical protein
MEDLTQYTPTELLKIINDNNAKHEAIKQEIINHTIEIDNIETLINEKIIILDELEKNYVILIEEMDRR